MSKRYLLVGDANSVHIHGFICAMKKKDPGLIIDVFAVKLLKRKPLCADKVYEIKLISWYARFFNKGTRFLSYLPFYFWHKYYLKKYDVIFIHYLTPYYYRFVKFYKRNTTKLISVFWGSDLFRIKERDIPKVRKIIELSDVINLTTDEMYKEYCQIFRMTDNKEITNFMFGMSVLDDLIELEDKIMDRQSFISELSSGIDITPKTKIVTIGYNGAPEQQHIKIIENLEKKEWEDTLFIFPITYGGTKKYHMRLEKALKESSLNWILITKFLSNRQVAKLRYVTDVFIQLQPTDALSAATQEHLFAGNRVIVGSWLPYKTLIDKGVVYHTVNFVDEIVVKLEEVLHSGLLPSKIKEKNRKAIAEMSAWSELIEPWMRL